MNKSIYEKTVNFGRKVKAWGGSHRGALIQFDENKVYITNLKRSAIYKILMNEPIGSGCFYAGEAPLMAEEIRERENKVLFEFKDRGNTRQVLIPSREPISREAEHEFENNWKQPDVIIPESFFDYIDNDMLITDLRVKGDKIYINQKRSDGSVEMNNVINLKSFVPLDYPEGEVNIFTSDLYLLKGFCKNIKLGIRDIEHPLCVECDFVGVGKAKILISNLIFSEKVFTYQKAFGGD